MVAENFLEVEMIEPHLINELSAKTGLACRKNVPLARYTAAQVGGAAEYLMEINTASQLEEVIRFAWENKIPYVILGGGSNVLVSDRGVKGLVLINRARGRGRVKFETAESSPKVWAESGINLGSLARMTAEHGFSGLEWAVGIPGTVGGAVVNNAGAFGSDMAGCLEMVEILQQIEIENHTVARCQRWTSSDMEYGYRSSRIKRSPHQVVVLGARLKLEPCSPDVVKERMTQYNQRRRATQPPGASLGSMFKNPRGDYAGRLIEACGLKGFQIGGAQISPLHANFFINKGGASADDVWILIQKARDIVFEKHGIWLELEIQLLGEFPGHKADSILMGS